MLKICTVCMQEKHVSEFHKNAKCKYGVDSRCAPCKNRIKRAGDATESAKLRGKEYRKGSAYKACRDKQAQSRAEKRNLKKEADRIAVGDSFVSRESAKAEGLTRYNEGFLCKRGHRAERSTANNQCMECASEKRHCPDYQEMKKRYWEENKPRLIKLVIKNQRERYARDPAYKAAIAARNMLKRVLSAGMNRKDGRSSVLLGFTGIQLMEHIEGLFSDGMTWDNYGQWHIDHIRPVSLYISEGVTDPSIVNALSNLQPLWAEDNFKKRDKFCIP